MLVARGPAHLVANGVGGIVALRFAAERPELVRSLNLHEPPVLGLVAEDARFSEKVAEINARTATVRQRIVGGDLEGGARGYVDDITSLPGGWAGLPVTVRETYLRNAVTWVAECDDPTAHALDLEVFKGMRRPVLLTAGGTSDPIFPAIAERLAERLWSVRGHIYAGAGPWPQASDPSGFVQVSSEFARTAPGFD